MNRIKKIMTVTLSCLFVISSVSGCQSSNKTEKENSSSQIVSDTNAPETKQPAKTSESETPTKPIYVIKSYNIYNGNETIDHYYNFDYEDNKLVKIEGYDTQGLGITYKTEINDDNNLTSFSSFDSKGAKSEYYKMDLYDDGTLKCEHRYSPTDEVLYKYDYTYNDNKQIDTKTGYSNGTTQSGKSGYTYDKKQNIVQQTNYSVKGDATSYIKYFYKKGKLVTEKYFSKEGKIYYINKYNYNKNGKITTVYNYADKKCKKIASTTKYKYNKKGLKTDEFRYSQKNKLDKHINIKYQKIKVVSEKPWYLDWVYNKISE